MYFEFVITDVLYLCVGWHELLCRQKSLPVSSLNYLTWVKLNVCFWFLNVLSVWGFSRPIFHWFITWTSQYKLTVFYLLGLNVVHLIRIFFCWKVVSIPLFTLAYSNYFHIFFLKASFRWITFDICFLVCVCVHKMFDVLCFNYISPF